MGGGGVSLIFMGKVEAYSRGLGFLEKDEKAQATLLAYAPMFYSVEIT